MGIALTSSAASAQETCTFEIQGNTLAGPSAPETLDGTLAYSIGTDGTVTQAYLTPANGASLPVSGSITGRSIDFLVALGPEATLVLTGAADISDSRCPRSISGISTGPQPGDIGAWQGVTAGTTGSTSGAASGSNSASGGCVAPQTPCGSNCCPDGATCTSATQGICTCPDGTVQCGTRCVPDCPQGQSLDFDSCSCASACRADGKTCASDTECCSGSCVNGSCLGCPALACPGIGCVDPSIDNNNCGGCGIVCAAPKASCTDGVCACQPDGLPCTKHFDCCSDSCDPSGVCGCVPVGGNCSSVESVCCGNGESTICMSGICRYLDSRHACFTDIECLTGICSNGGCISCVDPGGACTRSAECCNYNGLGCVNGICPL